MKQEITKGKTSKRVFLKLRHATTGAALTGVTFDASGLTAYYIREGGTATAITLVTQTVGGTYASGGFVEVDATNMPGIYQFDVPNAVIASSAGIDSAVVTLKGAANMEQVDMEFQLNSIDLMDAVRAGITALPNANAEAAGGLFTRGTGAGQINQANNGQIDTNAVRFSGDSTAADNAEAFFDGSGYNASASAIGTAAAVTAISTGGITSASFAAGALNAAALAADAGTEIAAAIKALVVETEGNFTLGQVMSILLAFAAGRTADGGATFSTPDNAEVRIQGTVNGSNERTAITLTPSA